MRAVTKATQEVGGGTGSDGAPASAASWALTGLAMSALLAALGTSVANVGLPALANAFDVSFRAVQWVVLSYLLAVTTLIVGVGRLGDLIGRRRLLLAGIALFTGASLACSVTSALWALVAARAVQGAGAAVMMALSMAMVRDIAPPTKSASVMGLLGTTSAVGTALGPSLGGFLLAGVGWRALFFLTVPLGLAALVIARRHLPQDVRSVHAGLSRFDSLGTALLALSLGAYALAMTAPTGQFGTRVMPLLLMTSVGVVAFVLVEARVASPLVRLTELRDRALLAGLTTNALVATVMMTTLVVGPFYLTGALGLDPARVGLAMTVGPLVAALTGVPAGRAADRFGVRASSLAGLVSMVVGTILLAVLPLASGIPGYVAPMILLTAGYALFQAANNAAVLTDVPATERGTIAGLLGLSRNLGLVTGASLMGATFARGVDAVAPGGSSPTAVAVGMRLTFALASVLLMLAVVIGATRPGIARRALRAGSMALIAIVSAAASAFGQVPTAVAPGRTAPTPPAPYPLVASGWGPTTGGGRFMSRWAEDWTGMRAAGVAPALKAIPIGHNGSLTLSAEARVRQDEVGNGLLTQGNSYAQTLFRGMAGADLRLGRHGRVYGEIASGQVDRLRRASTPNFQNDLSLQQLFVDVRGFPGAVLIGVMVGRQEFADGPRQLVSVSDGPNLHRTWNGMRLYAHGRRMRVGAFDLRLTRPAPKVLDEVADRGERVRGVNVSVMVARDPARGALYLDPFWIQSASPRLRVGDRVGADARRTAGMRLWGQRGRLSLDWTLAHQGGRAAGRDVNAWGLFAMQSITLAPTRWKPRLELRVDVASGGGTRGTGPVKELNPLYASSVYLGEGQFLGLRNLVMVTPGLSLAPTAQTRMALEYGVARRFDAHDAVAAGGGRVYPGTTSTGERTIGGLLRMSATQATSDHLSLFLVHEYLNVGRALRGAGRPSGSYSHIGATLRY